MNENNFAVKDAGLDGGDVDADGIVPSDPDAGSPAAGGAANGSPIPTDPGPPLAPLGASGLARLSADEVYIMHPLYIDLNVFQWAISHWSQPDVAVGYLPAKPLNVRIRRSDGAVIYGVSPGKFPLVTNRYYFEAEASLTAPFAADPTVANPEANDVPFKKPETCSFDYGTRFSIGYSGRIITECDCPGEICRCVDPEGTWIDAQQPSVPCYDALYIDGHDTIAGLSINDLNPAERDWLIVSHNPKVMYKEGTILEETETIRFFRELGEGFMYGTGTDDALTLKVWIPPKMTGVAVGTYPPPPAGIIKSNGDNPDMSLHFVPDGYGNVYYIVNFSGTNTKVLYRAAPGAAEPQKLYESGQSFALMTNN